MADEVQQGLRDGATRRIFAANLREACAKEEQAIDLLDRARAAMDA
jgi:hypothetical protein